MWTTHRSARSRSARSAPPSGSFSSASGAAAPNARGRSQAYVAEQSWWFDDYALFRAHSRPRGRAAVDRLARAAARPASRRAGAGAARSGRRHPVPPIPAVAGGLAVAGRPRRRARHGVSLFGDLPFMVDGDSADVWAHQQVVHARRLGRRAARRLQRHRTGLGHAGLPVGRRRRRRFQLDPRSRAPQRATSTTATASIIWSASIAPTAGRAPAATPFFIPADEPSQTALGERVLTILREPGTELIAEDLGTVPDFVRALAGAHRGAGLPCRAVGARLEHRRTAVQGSGRLPAALGGGVGHARYRADGGVVGPGAARRARARQRVPTVAATGARGRPGRRAVRSDGPRRRCSKRCSRQAPTCC